jgi:hypothetical protein
MHRFHFGGTVLQIGVLILCFGANAVLLGSEPELRTWTDVTGKHKIKAKFLSLDEENVVTLEKEDGSTLELPLAKLSKSDQQVAKDFAEKTDNPFETPSENPFDGASKPKAQTKKPTKGSASDSAETQVKVPVDLSNAELITLSPANDEWKIEVSELPDDGKFTGKVKSVPLPAKSNFFETQQGLAINMVAKKAAVGYRLDDPKPDGTTRVLICDLKTSKSTPVAVTSGKMSPLALHDDGQHLVMRREEFGFGNQDRLEIWRLEGKKIVKLKEWVPLEESWKSNNDVLWAEFLDADHLATSCRGGKVIVWSFPDLEPLYTFQLCDGAIPALSPDRKLLAFSNGDQVGLFAVAEREVAVMQTTPSKLQWPHMAYSPTGKQFGCVAHDRVLVWSAESGELIAEVAANGAHFNGGSDFPADGYFLAGNKFLLDVNNKLQFWQYDQAQSIQSRGGLTFATVVNGDKPGALIAQALPHTGALQLQKKALLDPNLFVFKEGATVSLDLQGISDPAGRTQAEAAITKALTAINCKIVPSAPLSLVLAVEGPKPREISYFGSGDYTVQEWIHSAKFMYAGKPIWQSGGTNVPFMVSLKRGENIEGVLRSHEKPNYGWFEQVKLPQFLQKPAAGQQAQSGFGLGQSKFTISGLN